eukprot:289709-Prorocentrum_minimum.AAC.1
MEGRVEFSKVIRRLGKVLTVCSVVSVSSPTSSLLTPCLWESWAFATLVTPRFGRVCPSGTVQHTFVYVSNSGLGP